MSTSDRSSPPGLHCPPPLPKNERVVLGHGSGGRLTADLIRKIFLPALSNPILDRLNDSAEIAVGGNRLVFTTDSFVVSPLTFPGGDIGSLAVNGTINDLAVVGAQPVALAAAFILEEGLPIDRLAQFVRSMEQAASRANVPIITADTKVVERGKADGLFVTSSGIGLVTGAVELGPERARVGDAVLVSGPIGDHGIAVMSAREGLEFDTTVVSDSAPLHELAAEMLACGGRAIHCMRDATRGGVATVVNELAASSAVEILIEEPALPVREAVRAACEILGLDPLYVACEGRLVAIVDQTQTEAVLATMQRHPLGRGAACIGAVTSSTQSRVMLRTSFGSVRLLDTLAGAQLPRIC